MIANENIYQSILQELSQIPSSYLPVVDSMLKKIKKDIAKKENNRNKIMAFAGIWEDMEDADFQGYLKAAKETNIEIKRDISW
jgi:hypothetical protein